jgi:hypothetical protein
VRHSDRDEAEAPTISSDYGLIVCFAGSSDLLRATDGRTGSLDPRNRATHDEGADGDRSCERTFAL